MYPYRSVPNVDNKLTLFQKIFIWWHKKCCSYNFHDLVVIGLSGVYDYDFMLNWVSQKIYQCKRCGTYGYFKYHLIRGNTNFFNIGQGEVPISQEILQQKVEIAREKETNRIFKILGYYKS